MLATSNCARRSSAAGVFVLEVSAAGEAAAASFAIATSSWFRVSPLGCSPPLVHCFWIVSACFSRCSLLFRVDCLFSRDYRVLCCIFADFRHVNRLYFCGAKILTHFSRVQANASRAGQRAARPAMARLGHAPAAETRNTCMPGTRVETAWLTWMRSDALPPNVSPSLITSPCSMR